jgi:hypothetical protein
MAFSAAAALPPDSVALLVRALALGLADASPTPWLDLRAALFDPAGVAPAAALEFAGAVQCALARAATEAWPPGALGAFLLAGGAASAHADAAAAAWAAAAPGVADALARRGGGAARARALAGAPAFVAVTPAASGGPAPGGGASEARAVVALDTARGARVEFEATKGDVAAALAALAQLRKALAAPA